MTRLIDADALKEAIETYDKFACLPNGKIYPFRELKHPEMFEAYIHFRDIIKAIDNAPTVFFDWEKSDVYLDCVKRIRSLEKENEELRQFLKKLKSKEADNEQ